MLVRKGTDCEKYRNCSVEELLQDDFFISSMINPTKESDDFWREMIEKGFIHSNNYQKACYLVDSLQVRADCISQEETDLLWNKIMQINNKNKREQKRKKIYHIFILTIGSVASILLLLLFVYIRNSSDFTPVVVSSIESIKAPESAGADIQLIFADNETMALEGKEAEIIYDDEGIAINNNDEKLSKLNKNGSETVIYNQLIVPKGKRSTLTLEDGSKLWINAGTRVVYPVTFAADEREIFIDGEVFLEVSHEEKRPFVVKSKDFNVEVLGTSFNFMAYESDNTQHVVLVSGAVKVKSKNDAETMLSPNEMFLFDNDVFQIQKVNVDDYISWKTGMYQYESERLDIIMKRLSRYYGEVINCEPEVAHLRCSGKLDLKDDLNVVLKGVSQTAPVNLQYDNGEYRIVNPKNKMPMK